MARAVDLAPFRLEEVAAVAEEEEEEDKEEREKEEDKVGSEEKEKSMSVFSWDLFAGLFVCIARAEDTFETALSWSCSLVRFCDAATAASQAAVCAALFDFFSFFDMLPQRQRKTQKYRGIPR